jgi:hypothetical protein
MTGWLRCVALLIVVGTHLVQRPAAASATVQQALTAPVPFFIADGAGKRGFRAGDSELARWALDAWQRSVVDGLRFAPSREDDALLRVYWIEAEDGRYGEAQPLLVGDRRGTAVYVRPDTSGLGAGIGAATSRDPLLREAVVYLTCLHETGHALGLTHTREFADIMYSFEYGGDLARYFGRYRAQLRSRADIASVSGLSPGDLTQLRARLAAR